MSKAYYFVKNFNWAEIKNLMCYGTKNPEILTSQQKMTRLYRATLRRYQAQKLEGYRTDFNDYNRYLLYARTDFQKIDTLEINSVEYNSLFQKYEDIQEELYDPNMIINDCRPYSPTSSRYLIFSDEQLNFDPFGYYKPRLMSERHPEGHLPFYEDYPMNDGQWNLWETFPENFDDGDYAAQEVQEINQIKK